MRFKNTLIVVLIFIIIAGLVYYDTVYWEPNRRKSDEEKNRVFQFDKEDVYKIEIIRGNEYFILEKINEIWMVTQPIEFDADEVNIDGGIFLFNTHGQKERSISDNRSDLEKFGLTPESPMIKIHTTDNIIYSLQFGNNNPSATSVYANIPGSDEIFLTSRYLGEWVDKPLVFFRDKTILNFDVDKVSGITYKQPGNNIVIEKLDDSWTIKEPIECPAEEEVLDYQIKWLREKLIIEYVDENPIDLQKYGLLNTEYSVIISEEGNDKVSEIFIGNSDGNNFFAMDNIRPQVFLLDSSTVNQFTMSLFDFRDKSIVDYDINIVDEMKVTYKNTLFHFIKEGGNWNLVSPYAEVIKNKDIPEIPENIFWSKSEEFLDNYNSRNMKNYGLNPPASDITLISGGSELVRIQIGDISGGKLYLYNYTKKQLVKVRESLHSLVVEPFEEYYNKIK
ncbi:DUF4340 domain-containing protein [candidate division KSB1 bacterium]